MTMPGSEQRVFNALQPIITALGYKAEIDEPLGFDRRNILIEKAVKSGGSGMSSGYVWMGGDVEELAEWLAYEIRNLET